MASAHVGPRASRSTVKKMDGQQSMGGNGTAFRTETSPKNFAAASFIDHTSKMRSESSE